MCKKDAKVKGAGRPHLTLRLRFNPPPAPGNQGRRNGPPVGKTERRRRGSGTAHKGTGCSRGQFHRSPRPQPWAATASPSGRPGQPPISPHLLSFGFAAGSGFPLQGKRPQARPIASLGAAPRPHCRCETNTAAKGDRVCVDTAVMDIRVRL